MGKAAKKPKVDKSSEKAGSVDSSNPLTDMQARFVREYLIDKNGTQAAIRAGYEEKHAASQAYQLLHNTPVRSAIRRQIKAQYKRLDITADRILHEIMLIATADLADAYDASGALLPMRQIPEQIRRAIAGVEVFEETEIVDGRRQKIGETTKLRLVDKKGALELLAKNLTLLTEVHLHKGKLTLEQIVSGSMEDPEEK